MDSLAARLREPRVQRVIEPLISGSDTPVVDPDYDDDVCYAQDLGLLAPGIEARIANPIYQEVIVIFDRRPEEVRGHPLAEVSEVTSPAGRHVTLLRA